MDKSYFKLIILGISVIILSTFNSCQYNIVYHPNTIKPTFFKEKGDFNIGLDVSSLAGLNAAYAINDKFAVSATIAGYTPNKGDTIPTYNNEGSTINGYSINSIKFNDAEIALGYYKPLINNFTFETYLGYGYAAKSFKSITTDISYNLIEKNKQNYGEYSRYFIQPAIGKNGKFLDYGIASRITLIDYYFYNDRDLIFEQVIFTRFGYKRIKIMFELGFYTVAYYNSTEYDYSPIPISIGLGINYILNDNIR